MKNARKMPQKKYRYPQELLDIIEKESEYNNRSENSEVIYRLEVAYGLKQKESLKQYATNQ